MNLSKNSCSGIELVCMVRFKKRLYIAPYGKKIVYNKRIKNDDEHKDKM